MRQGQGGCRRADAGVPQGAEGDEKKTKGITEYFDIYQDLRERFEKMMVMLEDVRKIENIKVEAGKLNLAYSARRRGP